MNRLFLIISVIFFTSCAQIVPPSGGSKDEKPPQLIKTSPPSSSLNLYPKKIILYFNENIELKNKQTNVTITPDLNFTPTLKAFKKQIVITLPKDSLKPNTTYSINFRKSIADLNEGNTIENYNYIFSTGTIIDTASISGTAGLVKTNIPLEGIKVILRAANSNTKYTTFSDGSGNWALFNIAKGSYNLLLFDDKNANTILDNYENYFAKTINIPDSTTYFNTHLITHRTVITDNLKVNSVKYLNDYQISLKFNKPVSDIEKIKYSLDTDLNKKTPSLTATLQTDSFILYHSFLLNDTLNLTIQTDTFQKFTIIQPKNRKKTDLIISPQLEIVRRGDPIYFSSSIPVSLINSEKISINNDTSYIDIKLLNPSKLSLIHSKNINKEIIIKKGAFTDINGDVNEEDTLFIKVADEDKTGNYEFTIKDSLTTFSGTVMVKISNAFNEYILKTSIGKSNKLTAYLPGNYTLEIWEDTNENGIWDEGNYYENINPEKIILLKDFILIKPNWDTEGVQIYMD